MHAALRQHGVPAHAVVPQISLTSRRRNELVLLSTRKQKHSSKNVGNNERKEASACYQGRGAS